jgi:hypothetical protein
MIPPVDSYTPAVVTETTTPQEDTGIATAVVDNSSTQPQSFIDPNIARGIPQQNKAFSMRELNDLLKNLTKMIREFTKLWNPSTGGHPPTKEPVYRTLPYDPRPLPQLPNTGVRQPAPMEHWLTPIDQEAGTIIPDIEDAPAPADTAPTPADTTPATPTTPSTTPNTGGMGIGTLNSEDPEVIPDLDPELPAPPAPGTKEYSIGTTLSRSGQFLWKPASDKDGKLAILLPSRLTGKVKSVTILSADKSKILAKGKYSGVGNGDREHFRFSKAGSGYPDNAIVLITMKDGKTYNVKVKETSDRYER